jgi:ABC-2 type transport system ATP-binding protein
MEALKAIGITKKYKDVTAVDNLSFSVAKGELFSLLGVNGAGKTTTIKILTGLTQMTDGDAFLNGKSVLSDSSEIKSFIAVSPQETAVALGLSVKENLSLICGIHGFSREKRKKRISEVSSLLGLDPILNKKASKLSGGYQRRLSIAMALISEPEILFLDEPTLGLDVLARSDLWELIKALKGRITVILTTHYMEEAEELSDRVGIMRGGKLLICDTPDEIKKKTGENSLEKAFIKIVKEAEK